MVEHLRNWQGRLMQPKYPLYDDANEFFRRDDRNSMRVTAGAALEVCKHAASRGLWIVGIEGGRWQNPRFESRLDSIWDSDARPLNTREVSAINAEAAKFVEEQIISEPWGGVSPPDVFILVTRAAPTEED